MILRNYQRRAVDKIVTALKKHNNTLFAAATGAGKTIVLSEVCQQIIGKSGKALILQHRDILTSQNSTTFDKLFPNIHISFYHAKVKSWRGQVVYSMMQTLAKHIDDMPAFDMLIIDECHHLANNSYQKIIKKAKELNPNIKILGVTATPERADGKGLRSIFNNIADIVSIGELVRFGHLVPPVGFVVDIGTQDKLHAVKQTGGEYNQAYVEAIQNSQILNQKIIEHWEQKAAGRSTVVFCSTIQHAIDVKDAFEYTGYCAETIHSKVPTKKRIAMLKAFNNGEINVLTTPLTLTEGWDAPICSCVVLLRTSSHKSTVIQMAGRGLRTYPGKRDCKILDFGISLLVCGDLNADVFLKEDEQKASRNKTKICPSCSAELPIQTKVCPLCGYEFKVELTDDDEYDVLAEFAMLEIDVLNNSPFKWTDLFGTGKVLIANGFGCWAAVCSTDRKDWYAMGGKKSQVTTLNVSHRLGAISAADDFMRQNETSQNAKKAARWLTDPMSNKQQEMLAKMGKRADGISKRRASALITFYFHQRAIERSLGI